MSDAHLGARTLNDNLQRERKVLSFFDYVKNERSSLFIVGDLFDFWFEYRNVLPKENLKIIAKLLELKEKKIEVFYVAGNHDFWIGNFLKNELGIEYFEYSAEIEISGKKFYIVHGDGLKKSDKGYRIIKKVLRNRFNIFLYKLIHPDIGIPLAKRVSRTSRIYTSNKDYGSDEEYKEFAEKKFLQGFDYIIFGHTHKPDERKINEKKLMNIGDWITNFTYAYFDGKNLELKKWK